MVGDRAGRSPGWPDPVLLLLFAIGAVAMRGAGCTLNDIADRDYDARVARTRLRPLPSGRVTVAQAGAFLLAQLAVGAAVLFSLNRLSILLGLAVLGLIGTYPFMKRITYWPQLFLGLNFNWGALLGWTAVTGSLGWPAVLLYLGGVFWTLGYDTIYAHQDKEDDARIGVKSSALALGSRTRPFLFAFYAARRAALGIGRRGRRARDRASGRRSPPPRSSWRGRRRGSIPMMRPIASANSARTARSAGCCWPASSRGISPEQTAALPAGDIQVKKQEPDIAAQR